MILLDGLLPTNLGSITAGHVFMIRDTWTEQATPALAVGLRVADAPQQAPNSSVFLSFPLVGVPVLQQLATTLSVLDLKSVASIRVPDLVSSVTVSVDAGRPGHLALHNGRRFIIVSKDSKEKWVDIGTGQLSGPPDIQKVPPPWYVTRWHLGVSDANGDFQSLREYGPQ